MSKKFTTFDELLIEKQKLEALFHAQKELVKYEINDIRQGLNPAFNALEFIKKISVRNKENPIMQTGLSLLIDLINDKTKNEDAGILRSTVFPFFIKNFASNMMAGHADDIIEQLVSLFGVDSSSDEEKIDNEN